MKSDLTEPYCRECSTKLTQLGNTLRDSYGNSTTYGWCTSCHYYKWSFEWFTEKSSSEIIKDQYR